MPEFVHFNQADTVRFNFLKSLNKSFCAPKFSLEQERMLRPHAKNPQTVFHRLALAGSLRSDRAPVQIAAHRTFGSGHKRASRSHEGSPGIGDWKALKVSLADFAQSAIKYRIRHVFPNHRGRRAHALTSGADTISNFAIASAIRASGSAESSTAKASHSAILCSFRSWAFLRTMAT